MRMLRWMSGEIRKDGLRKEDIGDNLGQHQLKIKNEKPFNMV